MAINVIWEGDWALATAVFTVPVNGIDTLTDPGAVTFRWKTPDGVDQVADVYLTSGAVARLSVGVYTWTRQLLDPGQHRIRAEGTSPCRAVMEATITVQDSAHGAA